jgi:hypothetical protein
MRTQSANRTNYVLAGLLDLGQGPEVPYEAQLVPAALIIVFTLIFFALERIRPGRLLPSSPGWYTRAAVMNLMQLALIGFGGLTWNRYFRGQALLDFGNWSSPMAEGAYLSGPPQP